MLREIFNCNEHLVGSPVTPSVIIYPVIYRLDLGAEGLLYVYL